MIPPIFLQHSLDCVAVRLAGAMHASKGAAVPRKINNTENPESHRRISRLYPTGLSDASDVDHIFSKVTPRRLVNIALTSAKSG